MRMNPGQSFSYLLSTSLELLMHLLSNPVVSEWLSDWLLSGGRPPCEVRRASLPNWLWASRAQEWSQILTRRWFCGMSDQIITVLGVQRRAWPSWIGVEKGGVMEEECLTGPWACGWVERTGEGILSWGMAWAKALRHWCIGTLDRWGVRGGTRRGLMRDEAGMLGRDNVWKVLEMCCLNLGHLSLNPVPSISHHPHSSPFLGVYENWLGRHCYSNGQLVMHLIQEVICGRWLHKNLFLRGSLVV